MGLIPALRTATPGQRIRAADFNANFDDVRATVNASAVFVDVPRVITALQTFAGGASFTGGTLDVTGATLAGFPNFARRDQANVFTQPITFNGTTAFNAPLVIGGDPGGSDGFRSTANARFGNAGTGANISLYASTYGENGLLRWFGNDAVEKLRIGATNNAIARIATVGPVNLDFSTAGLDRGRLRSSGVWAFGVDDSVGNERVQVRGSLRVRDFSAIPAVYIDCPDADGFESRLVFQRNGTTRFENNYRRDADLLLWTNSAGASIATLTQAGAFAVAAGLSAGGVITTPGSVTIGGVFNGSGAGLSSVPWGALIGVPASFPPSTHGHLWGDIAGVPNNVVNAITQSQADARYRQLGAVPWSDLTGMPDLARRDLANTFVQTVTLGAATAFGVTSALLGGAGAVPPALVGPTGIAFSLPEWTWIRCNVGGRTGYVPVLFDNLL